MYKLIICIAVLTGIFAIGVYVPLNWLNPKHIIYDIRARWDKQACEDYFQQKEAQNQLENSGLHWKTNDSSLVEMCEKFNVNLD